MTSERSAVSRTEMATERWLTILGLGEDGVEGLSALAKRLLASAEVVWGGRRHLELAGSLIRNGRAWPSPLDNAMPEILSMRGRHVCVLASGDPFLWGIGATLIRHFDADEIPLPAGPVRIQPGCRAAWLAIAGGGLPIPARATVGADCAPSLPRRSHHRALLGRLESDKLASLLTARAMGRSRLTVLEAMGGPRERIRTGLAQNGLPVVDQLNTVAIEVVCDRGAWSIPLTPGLPDSVFENDGQLTKRDTRAVTLSALAPFPGQLLWDVGAGSGSIAIEWMLRHASCRAVAVEERQDRADRILRNALALGVPDLKLIQGSAPQALAALPTPDAVFIGGGAGDPGVLDACWNALAPGGRFVVNGVSIETETILIDRFRRFGGELRRISFARAEGVGTMHGGAARCRSRNGR